MRLRYAVLPLLLSACVSGPEYQRGAYRPPVRAPVRAPTTNPTTDAPRYAPPGHAPMPGAYPRSPYSRVLPPTKEPTVFAAEVPKASKDPLNRPELFDLPVPLPEGAYSIPSGICADDLSLAASAINKEWAARNVPEPMRQCLIGHLMAECTKKELNDAQKGPNARVLTPGREAAHAAAVRHKVKACAVAPLDPEAEILRDSILEQWRKMP